MARLDRGPVSGAACGPDMPAIEVRSLSFAYPDADAAVLEGLDWVVPQGAFALLVGGTGSGKSTLLSLLKPEIAPAGERTGGLRVLGENVADMDVRASAERVGYVFQDPENQIVCETVWHEMAFGLENLGMSRDEMRRRVAETSYFFGLEDWLHRDTDTLSGGRKQLLSLAAVLALRPRVLLLDEPTSQLDPVAEKNFLHALFRVNRELGCTVVVATHQPRPMLEYATCAYRIEGGSVREAADIASLGHREELFSDEMPGWGGSRRAKNGIFSNVGGQQGSFDPRAGAAGAKRGLKSGKSAEFEAQIQPQDGSGAPTRAGGCRIFPKMHAGSATTLARSWFRYDRTSGWVLRGLDAAFSAGAVHAIVGGNGCGKSTLLSVLAKTVKLQRGRMERAAGSAALLPQNPKALLVAETVHDELMEWASTCGYDEAMAQERAASLGLAGLGDRHPYDLSGGQRQLLALAKLLLIGPELLLLDEPTKGLDLVSRRIIARALRDHAQAGGTVIMATHDLDFAEQVADDIAMMFDGEVACMEPPADFFADNVFYRA
ncbi:ATP-binding cassette domain-containing protein [Collinsella sp. AM16-21]|uniref:ABC transporter ATP-binding protein n=1 Tax=Collinsella sp. AM16-21 TaxID=2292026 RepID=UPI000E5216A1|nr:ABC transporter ATP-binding protein [Collinsella sp. AM16-21]RHI13474.1 ATP-binding cassette domain-containing protein [Collinsella sp. AM16-21]